MALLRKRPPQNERLDLAEILERIRDAIARAQAEGTKLFAIARAAGIAPSALTRLMKGERGVSLETAERLCAALGLKLDVTTRPQPLGKNRKRGSK